MSVRNGDLFRALKTLAEREASGVVLPEYWDDWTDEEIVFLAANPGMVYVNVYRLDRVCGGQEEGGWWFDTGDVELSIACDSEESAEARAEMLAELYVSHGNRYSVIYYRKDDDYSVSVEEKPAADWPAVYPHYE